VQKQKQLKERINAIMEHLQLLALLFAHLMQCCLIIVSFIETLSKGMERRLSMATKDCMVIQLIWIDWARAGDQD